MKWIVCFCNMNNYLLFDEISVCAFTFVLPGTFSVMYTQKNESSGDKCLVS